MAGSNFIIRGGADFSSLKKEIEKTQKTISNFNKDVQNGIKNTFSGISETFKNSLNGVSGKMKSSFNGIKSIFRKIGKLIVAMFAVTSVKNFVNESRAMYAETVQNEQKLATVMKTRMGASNQAIQGMLDFMAAEQKLGVVSSGAMTAGAQELATYVRSAESLKTLIPVMNNIATQQYGMDVSASQLHQTATMLGKVMDGQLGGLDVF